MVHLGEVSQGAKTGRNEEGIKGVQSEGEWRVNEWIKCDVVYIHYCIYV